MVKGNHEVNKKEPMPPALKENIQPDLFKEGDSEDEDYEEADDEVKEDREDKINEEEE